MSTKKAVPSYVLFIIAAVSYGLSYFLGGVIGEGLSLLGLVCLLMAIIGLFRELKDKKKNKANDNNPK